MVNQCGFAASLASSKGLLDPPVQTPVRLALSAVAFANELPDNGARPTTRNDKPPTLLTKIRRTTHGSIKNAKVDRPGTLSGTMVNLCGFAASLASSSPRDESVPWRTRDCSIQLYPPDEVAVINTLDVGAGARSS
jgi:hypothetical protein